MTVVTVAVNMQLEENDAPSRIPVRKNQRYFLLIPYISVYYMMKKPIQNNCTGFWFAYHNWPSVNLVHFEMVDSTF